MNLLASYCPLLCRLLSVCQGIRTTGLFLSRRNVFLRYVVCFCFFWCGVWGKLCEAELLWRVLHRHILSGSEGRAPILLRVLPRFNRGSRRCGVHLFHLQTGRCCHVPNTRKGEKILLYTYAPLGSLQRICCFYFYSAKSSCARETKSAGGPSRVC